MTNFHCLFGRKTLESRILALYPFLSDWRPNSIHFDPQNGKEVFVYLNGLCVHHFRIVCYVLRCLFSKNTRAPSLCVGLTWKLSNKKGFSCDLQLSIYFRFIVLLFQKPFNLQNHFWQLKKGFLLTRNKIQVHQFRLQTRKCESNGIGDPVEAKEEDPGPVGQTVKRISLTRCQNETEPEWAFDQSKVDDEKIGEQQTSIQNKVR